ncbi:MAG: cobyric acid synthase [Prevotella sp.]|nr:cobyric acid synthase [Prevotella sp.]
MKKLHPIMFVGTGSDVGKSILAAAFCRIFRQDGYQPAPFKAQNMALNSYATPEGLEIGRAQAVQAEAAGIPCHTDMQPLLLKPQSDHTSQVVLHGRPIGTRDAYDFWRRRSDNQGSEGAEVRECEGTRLLSSPIPEHSSPTRCLSTRLSSYPRTPVPSYPREMPPSHPDKSIDFRAEVCGAFDRLAQRFNPIVMEGAGSISEINLRDTDLVNLPMARHAQADVILVGDIDRGGVFASVYGSIALQTEEDRRLIKGIIINKFRGDMRLFDSGRQMMEEICGIPVLGVIPYYNNIHIEEEDSVALHQRQHSPSAESSVGAEQRFRPQGRGKLRVAVVLLRHLSNYTDFDALEQDPRVNLFYTNNTDDILKADIVIVPGSKSTLDDLYELRRNGVAQAIVRAHREGASVLGICGGYQMMGVEVCDPDHVEGDIERLPGLGLLPTTTTMSGEKVTRQVRFRIHESGVEGSGYEIHMGETRPFGDAPSSPLCHLDDGRDDGYRVSQKCMGTYVHGILDNTSFVDYLLQPFADVLDSRIKPFDYAAFKQQQYDLLADHVRRHVDMERLYRILEGQ